MPDGAMLVWFILTGANLASVIWDSVTNGVFSWARRAAWILVTAYTGPDHLHHCNPPADRIIFLCR